VAKNCSGFLSHIVEGESRDEMPGMSACLFRALRPHFSVKARKLPESRERDRQDCGPMLRKFDP
jgi:hypothetical protein